MRLLDLCLNHLEDAQERGDTVLSVQLAGRVGEVIGPLAPGMSIVDVIEMVFNEQERYLAGSNGPHAKSGTEQVAMRHRPAESPGRGAPSAQGQPRQDTEESALTEVRRHDEVTVLGPVMSDPVDRAQHGPITECEARKLTERIRTATRHVCLLLHEVHERRAWVPLGYSSWEQYVQGEFSISRTRSYELLDQANVILDLRRTAGMSELPDVSAYVALQIKPRLSLIKETLRQRVREANGENTIDIVAELVEEHRRQVAQSRRLVQERRVRRPQSDADGQDHFSEAIDLLAKMAATGCLEGLVDVIEPLQIESVESAILWLGSLLTEWKRKHPLACTDALG